MGFIAVVLVLIFVIALIAHIWFIAAVAAFVAGLYGLSRLWTRSAVRHLQVRRRFVDHAFTGDEVTVDLIVQNKGLLPIPWMEIRASVPWDLVGGSLPPQVLSLGAREERRFSYTLRCRRRGYHTVGWLTAHTGDVLGIEERLLTFSEPNRLTVYPRVVPLQRLGLPTRSALATLPARTPLFEDPSRIMGVRDYRTGDSPRRIHWTATARIGRLMVKQYQPAVTRETLLCLDLDGTGYPFTNRYEASELAIVVAASLAYHIAVEEGLPVGLATEARDSGAGSVRRITLRPRSGRGQLMSVLSVLALVQLSTKTRFADVLRQESVNLAWGSTVVAITGRVDQELAQTMLYLKRRGHAVALVVVQPANVPVDRVAALVGVPIHRVWDDRDLAVMA